MVDISWPHVRQVIVNDNPISERPNRRYINRISRLVPDVRVLGFGRVFDGTWYLILESKFFPYHVDGIGARGAISATSLSNYLPKKASP